MKFVVQLLIGAFTTVPAQVLTKSTGDPEAGRVVYEKNCKACHGPAGQGNPAMVKASKGAMQDLSSKAVQSRTDEQLARDIAGGTGQKKAIKPLSEEQMKDVIALVRAMAKT